MFEKQVSNFYSASSLVQKDIFCKRNKMKNVRKDCRIEMICDTNVFIFHFNDVKKSYCNIPLWRTENTYYLRTLARK
jgi:hypothetical protein